jgi:hypothetical protein
MAVVYRLDCDAPDRICFTMGQQTLLVRRRKRGTRIGSNPYKESRSRSFSRHVLICTVYRSTGTRQAKSIVRCDPIVLSIHHLRGGIID